MEVLERTVAKAIAKEVSVVGMHTDFACYYYHRRNVTVTEGTARYSVQHPVPDRTLFDDLALAKKPQSILDAMQELAKNTAEVFAQKGTVVQVQGATFEKMYKDSIRRVGNIRSSMGKAGWAAWGAAIFHLYKCYLYVSNTPSSRGRKPTLLHGNGVVSKWEARKKTDYDVLNDYDVAICKQHCKDLPMLAANVILLGDDDMYRLLAAAINTCKGNKIVPSQEVPDDSDFPAKGEPYQQITRKVKTRGGARQNYEKMDGGNGGSGSKRKINAASNFSEDAKVSCKIARAKGDNRNGAGRAGQASSSTTDESKRLLDVSYATVAEEMLEDSVVDEKDTAEVVDSLGDEGVVVVAEDCAVGSKSVTGAAGDTVESAHEVNPLAAECIAEFATSTAALNIDTPADSEVVSAIIVDSADVSGCIPSVSGVDVAADVLDIPHDTAKEVNGTTVYNIDTPAAAESKNRIDPAVDVVNADFKVESTNYADYIRQCARLQKDFTNEKAKEIVQGSTQNDMITPTLFVNGFLSVYHRTRWLNDEVLSTIMIMLNEREKRLRDDLAYPNRTDTLSGTNYYYSTFLFAKLFTDRMQYDFNAVATYAKHVNLFKKGKLFFPLNHKSSHWNLVVLLPSQKLAFTYDSLPCKEDKMIKYMKLLIRYIYDDAVSKRFFERSDADAEIEDWNCIIEECPKQKNDYDCGVFTVVNTLYLSEDAPLDFGQSDMPEFRNMLQYLLLLQRIPDERCAATHPSIRIEDCAVEVSNIGARAPAKEVACTSSDGPLPVDLTLENDEKLKTVRDLINQAPKSQIKRRTSKSSNPQNIKALEDRIQELENILREVERCVK